jgi:hypothetical protein
MGKLDGKVAVITGGSSSMALAGAKCSLNKELTFSSRAGARKLWMKPSS